TPGVDLHSNPLPEYQVLNYLQPLPSNDERLDKRNTKIKKSRRKKYQNDAYLKKSSSLVTPMTKSTAKDTKHMKGKVTPTMKFTISKTKFNKNQYQQSELLTTTPSNDEKADKRNTKMTPTWKKGGSLITTIMKFTTGDIKYMKSKVIPMTKSTTSETKFNEKLALAI
ncbi:4664_t:CDS:2, partial [Gigaspora margarita]